MLLKESSACSRELGKLNASTRHPRDLNANLPLEWIFLTMSLRFKNRILGKYGRPIPSVDQKGFSLLQFVLLLPVVLFLVGWLSLQILQKKEILKDQRLCHSLLISGQEKVGKNISSLLQLNRTAQVLRTQMLAARAALAGALALGNLPAAKAARLWIKRIQVQKKILIQTQKSLLWSSKAELTKSLYRIQAELQARHSAPRNRSRPLFNVKIQNFAMGSPRVAVLRSNSPDPFPEYELAPQFSRKQALVLYWQSRFDQKKTGFKTWVPFNLTKKSQCGVSLKENFGAFQAIPAPDKFF